MLTNLRVQNFKAWQRLEVRLGRVTALFGANSSGKSSLIQFLLLLKQTKNATDRGLVLDFGGPEQIVNLGSFHDVISKHVAGKKLRWTIDWKLPEEIVVGNPEGSRRDILFSGDSLSTNVAVSYQRKGLHVDFLNYDFANRKFGLWARQPGSTSYRLFSAPSKASRAQQSMNFRFRRIAGRSWELPPPIKTHLFPDHAKTYFQNADFLSTFEASYEQLMDRIYYLGPLREYPKREYRWAGARPEDVGKRGEFAIDAILAATARREQRNMGPRTHFRPFQEVIARWLKRLGLIESFRIQEIARGSNLFHALVRKDQGSPEVSLTDVGFGVSQVLPALVLLNYVPENSVVVFEQPEIHLHPRVQSELADAILQISSWRNLQVILESHSEHMLRRFQRRVAEEKFLAEDIKLYFVTQSNGRARLGDLKLNTFGEIENWPKNFFGDDMGEIAAIRLSGLQRKKASNEQG